MVNPRLVPGSGSPARLGADVHADGVDFAVYSAHAEQIEICLFDEADRETDRFALDGRDGDIHFGRIEGIGSGARYGLRADGAYDPGRGFWFDPDKLLVDPWAQRIDRPFELDKALSAPRGEAGDTASLVPKAFVCKPLAVVRPKQIQAPGLIYELNVRGFTKLHPDVPERLRGTLAALTEPVVIEHLHRIGVDTVELMPMAAWANDRHLPALGLTNSWGYNPITMFAPDPRLCPGGMGDVRELTAAYSEAGIAVVLDVVYNHTGEGDDLGPVLSFRGLDALSYYRYRETEKGLALDNLVGTGNALDTSHPIVQRLTVESLRHWVEAGGISGFRFDLAPVLGRTEHGYDPHAPLIDAIRKDKVLGKCLLIAEPWDPAPGGYQLGHFPAPFYEWNDQYRDTVRRFWRGDEGIVGRLADVLAGSARQFRDTGRHASASVNFLTAHDGFTLADLVSYERKHNAANGEDGRDGHDHNYSWNNGVEGPSADQAVQAARRADILALLATLYVSRGTPMLLAGDEMGRSQQGNNNAYAQDNALSWVDWDGADADLIAHVAALAELRRNHPALHAPEFLDGHADESGRRDCIWYNADGREMEIADWQRAKADILGLRLLEGDDAVLIWFNRAHADRLVHLPKSPLGRWQALAPLDDGVDVGGRELTLPARSVRALVAVTDDVR